MMRVKQLSGALWIASSILCPITKKEYTGTESFVNKSGKNGGTASLLELSSDGNLSFFYLFGQTYPMVFRYKEGKWSFFPFVCLCIIR